MIDPSTGSARRLGGPLLVFDWYQCELRLGQNQPLVGVLFHNLVISDEAFQAESVAAVAMLLSVHPGSASILAESATEMAEAGPRRPAA